MNIDESGKNLKYCIESLRKHQPKANIIVVGTVPKWYDGEVLPLDQKNNKGADIAHKILTIADHANGAFVLVSDDYFFITKKSTEVQFATKRMTEVTAEDYPPVFASLVKRDGQELLSKGYDCINYGSHAPIHTSTAQVKKAAKVFDLRRVCGKGAILNISGGVKYEDIPEPKLREKKTVAQLKKLTFFSLNPLFNVYDELDKILSEPKKPERKPKKSQSKPKKKTK